MKRWIAMLLTGLLLAGCEIMPPGPSTTDRIEVIDSTEEEPADIPYRVEEPREVTSGRVQRQVAFPEAQYAALETTGSAEISGRLSLNGIPLANRPVSVAPVTTYSAEAAEQALAGRAVERADPRAQEYTHTSYTNSNGHFRIGGLPSGEFYVSGSGQDPITGEPRVIIQQVRLGNGQQLSVDLSR
ncbi:MAG: hypothetical protein ABR580_05180 [Halomonas sp.]